MLVDSEACISLPGADQIFGVNFFPHFSRDGIEEGVRQGEWLVVVVTMLSIIAEELADERPGGEEGHGVCHGPMVLCGSHAHSSHWDGQLCLSPLLVRKRTPYDPA